MPNADQARVLKRVTTGLGLADAGTYSSTLSTRNKTRNSAEIADFVTEAGFKVLQMLAEYPNEYRHNFVVEITPTYKQLLPDHQGQPAYVDIQPYNGAANWIPGDPLNFQKIDSYRGFPNIYDPAGKAHDANGSTLSGYYEIWEERFYFTGFAAKVGLAQIARSDVATKIPEILENTWIRLSFGEAAKSGLGQYDMGVVSLYGQKGETDLAEFKQGRRTFEEVSDPVPTDEVHAH